MSTRLRVEIRAVVVAGRYDEERAPPALRAELVARIGAALAEADRSGVLWTSPGGTGSGGGGLNQEAVERVVAGAVVQNLDVAGGR